MAALDEGRGCPGLRHEPRRRAGQAAGSSG